ncbi:unnamed protein product [Schistosoma curassoni]|uniref:Uncharacterized protein n=1 Tax=Schistosoma curassoni TaxID=6186 RepID=A0A183KW40_9TREM|nr:unnamed protein product [Schistosoma curassoni]
MCTIGLGSVNNSCFSKLTFSLLLLQLTTMEVGVLLLNVNDKLPGTPNSVVIIDGDGDDDDDDDDGGGGDDDDVTFNELFD